MKTKTAITKLPDSKKISFYMLITMVFCLLSCLALRAGGNVAENTSPYPETINNSSELIDSFDELTCEADLKLQSWMLDFNYQRLEADLKLQPWMLDFNYQTFAEKRLAEVNQKDRLLKAIKFKPASEITLSEEHAIIVAIK